MARYAKKVNDRFKIVETRTEIPKEMLAEKGLYEVADKWIDVERGSDAPEYQEFELIDGVIVWTRINYIPTLEEFKEQRLQKLNESAQNEIYTKYPLEKQLDALMGLENESYKQDMKTFIQDIRDKHDVVKQEINDAKSKDKVRGTFEWQ